MKISHRLAICAFHSNILTSAAFTANSLAFTATTKHVVTSNLKAANTGGWSGFGNQSDDESLGPNQDQAPPPPPPAGARYDMSDTRRIYDPRASNNISQNPNSVGVGIPNGNRSTLDEQQQQVAPTSRGRGPQMTGRHSNFSSVGIPNGNRSNNNNNYDEDNYGPPPDFDPDAAVEGVVSPDLDGGDGAPPIITAPPDMSVPPPAGQDDESSRASSRDPTHKAAVDRYLTRQSLSTRNPAATQPGTSITNRTEKIGSESATITVQGGRALRTWSYLSNAVERVKVEMNTEGRPLNADLELWQGPDNAPCRIRVYVEDGTARPFYTVIETPRGPNTVAIRNISEIEFPISACVSSRDVEDPRHVAEYATGKIIQGGALRTYPFQPMVNSILIMLNTDGRPLNARIELLQGPDNNKQVVEIYKEDGFDRPFYAILPTPGSGNTVRIVNIAPIEFPLYAFVEPVEIDDNPYSNTDVVVGGEGSWFGDMHK